MIKDPLASAITKSLHGMIFYEEVSSLADDSFDTMLDTMMETMSEAETIDSLFPNELNRDYMQILENSN